MQRVESCGDLLHNMEIAPEFEEPKFAYTREHQPPFALGMLTDATRQFENRNMCCKVCKARIPTEVTSEPTFCDTENGTKFKIHTQVHNQQPAHFLTAETNRLNGLASSVPESLMSIKKNEVTGKSDSDLRWKDIRVLVNALNRLSSTLAKSERSHELVAGNPEEAEGSEYLSKEASDAIRCVESCLAGLKTGAKRLHQDASKEPLMETIIQEELSDVMNSFLPNTASANFSVLGNSLVTTGIFSVLGNSLVTTGIGLNKNEISGRAESLQHSINGRYDKASSLHHVPSKTISRPMEMGVLYSKDNLPTKPFQPTYTRMSSQPIGGTTFLASRPYPRNQMENPYKERKVEDWMLGNKAESTMEGIRPLYQTPNEIYQMPRLNFQSNHLLPYREQRLQRLPDSSSWFSCHTNDRSPETQLEYESILEDKFNKSRASKMSTNLRHLKEYKNNNRLESESDSNLCRNGMVHNKDGFPSQMLKQQTLIDKQPSDISRSFTFNSKWKHDDAVGHCRFNDRKHLRRKLLHHKREVDNAYANSSSSSWRNQESYPSSSDTEKFYTSGHSRRQKSAASTTSSESGIYSPLPSRPYQCKFVSNSGEERSSYTSDEDYELTSSTPSYTSEEYSSPNSSSDQVSISGDSDDYGLSCHGKIRQLQHHKDVKYLSMDSASDASNPTRNQRKATLKQPKKQGGAWTKLKDKFSIIFHHHHHHHHHHHRVGEDDDRDRSNRDSRIKHGKYVAKQNGKKEAGKHAVDKVGKSIINAEAWNDEQKHLGRLVTGLFSHIKHKKKSKTFASKTKRLGKGKHEGKNMWKKKHWWQMLHPHNQVKRLGFGHKN